MSDRVEVAGFEGLGALSHVTVRGDGSITITSRIFEFGPSVSGTETCTTTSTGATIVVGDVTAYRDVAMRCTDRMSDPRLSGNRTLLFAIDERADRSADLWGTTVVSNADGTWEGFVFGTIDAGCTTHRAHSLLRGTGAYDGLLFRLEVVGTPADGFDLTGEFVPMPGQ